MFFIEPLFLLAGQDPTVSSMAQKYIYVSLPGVLCAMQFQATKRFMIAQKVFNPIAYFQFFLLFEHLIAMYLFVYTFGFGYLGAAIGTTITNFTSLFGLTGLLIFWKGLIEPESLHCPNKDSFHGLWEYLKVGGPSAIMLIIEWISFEIIGLYAGMLGVIQLGAHVIMANFGSIIYMFPMGLSFATSSFVGNCFGKGQSVTAKKYVTVSFWIAFTGGLIAVFCLITFSDQIYGVYTQDQEILAEIREAIKAVAALFSFGYVQGDLKGVFKALNKQFEGAIYTGILYICVGNTLCLL